MTRRPTWFDKDDDAENAAAAAAVSSAARLLDNFAERRRRLARDARSWSPPWAQRLWCLRCHVEVRPRVHHRRACVDDGLVADMARVWPYGPPDVHQDGCALRRRYTAAEIAAPGFDAVVAARFCDCLASAADDDEFGRQV